MHSGACANMPRSRFCKRLFVMAGLAIASRAAVLGLAITCAQARAAEAEPRPTAAKPVCLNAAETREQVKGRHFLEPFAALRYAALQHKAEALSAKLCHSGDEFFYEITLLHRDGRLVRVAVEAGTGKPIARPPHEAHEAPHEAREPIQGAAQGAAQANPQK